MALMCLFASRKLHREKKASPSANAPNKSQPNTRETHSRDAAGISFFLSKKGVMLKMISVSNPTRKRRCARQRQNERLGPAKAKQGIGSELITCHDGAGANGGHGQADVWRRLSVRRWPVARPGHPPTQRDQSPPDQHCHACHAMGGSMQACSSSSSV